MFCFLFHLDVLMESRNVSVYVTWVNLIYTFWASDDFFLASVLTRRIAKFHRTMHNRLFIYKKKPGESYVWLNWFSSCSRTLRMKRSVHFFFYFKWEILTYHNYSFKSVLFHFLSIFIFFFHYQLLRKITKKRDYFT